MQSQTKQGRDPWQTTNALDTLINARCRNSDGYLEDLEVIVNRPAEQHPLA